MNGVRRGRTRLFALFLTAWAAVVVGRLVQLQIAQGSRYRARAQRQQERRIEIAAPRGSILDREGRELAVSVEVVLGLRDPGRRARTRARRRRRSRRCSTCRAGEILDEARIREGLRLARAARSTRRSADKIRALKLPGIHFVAGAPALLPEGPPRRRRARLRRHGRHAASPASSTSTTSPIRGKPGEIVALTDARRSRYGEAETANSRPAAGGRDARALARLGRPVRRRARARRGDGASTTRSRAASSCSIPGTARSWRWRARRTSTRTSSGATRPSRGATARSPTPTSRARPSRS